MYTSLNMVIYVVSERLQSEDERVKIYKNKVLTYIEEPIHKVFKDYEIPAIGKLAFNLEHFQILGKN